ncbi:MAG TPA: tetratricopeptide repeat protein [Bryobacteraceae bacterium]
MLRVVILASLVLSMLRGADDLAGLYVDAKRAQAAGDLATATRKYEEIVKLRPKMAEAHANLGNLYYQRGEIARAKTAYQTAVAQDAALTGPHFFLGVIAFGEHDYVIALMQLKRAAAADSANPLIRAYLGYTYFAQDNYVDAAKNLENAASLSPADIDILYHLSKSYAHLADRAFAQLQSQFPRSGYTILVRAHLAEAKGRWQDAAEDYGQALAIFPDNARLREKQQASAGKAAGNSMVADKLPADELADGSLTYKEKSLSGRELAQEISRLQGRLDSLTATGERSLYLRGESYQSLAYLTSLSVFEIDADSYRAHQLRAQMLEASDNDDGAINEYREVIKRKPDLQNIHFAIGSIYWKDHQLEKAEDELQLELKANPHHPQALYELGDICAGKNDLVSAEKYLLAAIKLQPRFPEARFALEKIYTESGRYDASLDQLRAVLNGDPGQATAHYRLGIVYRKMGRQQEAQQELALFEKSAPRVKQ